MRCKEKARERNCKQRSSIASRKRPSERKRSFQKFWLPKLGEILRLCPSFVFGKGQGKPPKKTRIFYSHRTPKIPGKDGINAPKNKEFLTGKKKKNKEFPKKQGKERQGGATGMGATGLGGFERFWGPRKVSETQRPSQSLSQSAICISELWALLPPVGLICCCPFKLQKKMIGEMRRMPQNVPEKLVSLLWVPKSRFLKYASHEVTCGFCRGLFKGGGG